MSSYHPNQDQSLRQINVGRLPLYISKEDQIIEAITCSDGESYDLEYMTYKEESHLFNSSLSVRTQEDDAGQKWAYDGVITYNPDLRVEAGRYFEILGNLVAEDEEMTVEKAVFTNVYLIGSNAVRENALISFYDELAKVNYSNDEMNTGADALKSLRVQISPRIVTPDQASDRLRVQLKGFYFALNALSIAVDKHEIKHVSLITSNGSMAYDRPAETMSETANLPALIDTVDDEVAQEEKMTLDSLSGNIHLKTQLEYVVASFRHPEVMKKWGAERPQGILLYGPPGTGKTSYAQAVANEIGGEFWKVDSTSIYKKWLGESEESIKNIFRVARNKKDPTVLLFDEFESIISRSDDDQGGSRATNSVSGVFKQEMNDLRLSNPNVIIFATTNHFDTIDESTIRAGRFDIKAYVELPDEQTRAEIFATKIAHIYAQLSASEFMPFAKDINARELAVRMGDKSGADIVEVLRRATFEKAMAEMKTGATVSTPISQSDLLRIIDTIRHE